MAAQSAEDFVLRLQQQVAGPAQVATSAIDQLNAKIQAEQAVLTGLEGELGAAAAKLRELGEGTDGAVNVTAFRKQQQAVTELQGAIDRTAASIKKLEGSGGLAKQADAMKAAKEEAGKLAAAAPTGKVNELAEAFGKLGGPVGQAGQKLFGLADGLKKMGGAAGSSFTIFAVGAALAIAAVVALAVGIVSLTRKLVEWADTDGRLGKAQEKLQKNLKELFGGAVKIGPLLDGFDKLVALFDKNTAAGKTLSFITNLIFQPLIDMAAKAIPYIERAFIVVLIWALKAYIAVKQFAATDLGKGLVTGLKVLAVVMGVVVGVVTAGAALLVLPFLLIGAAIAAVVVAVGYLINAVSGPLSAAWAAVSGAASSAWAAVKGAVQGAIDWLSGLSLSGIGTAIIQGLARGITSAAGAVLSAITGVVGGAIDSAKALLGIHSPSAVFEKMLLQVGAGAEQGGEKATPGVQDTMAAMVAPPAAPAMALAVPRPPGAPPGGRAEASPAAAEPGIALAFYNCVFGEGTSEERLEEWLTRIMDRYRRAHA